MRGALLLAAIQCVALESRATGLSEQWRNYIKEKILDHKASDGYSSIKGVRGTKEAVYAICWDGYLEGDGFTYWGHYSNGTYPKVRGIDEGYLLCKALYNFEY